MTPLEERELEAAATRIANEAALPILRSMYPSRSRGQMANEFRHFFISGAQHQDAVAYARGIEDAAKLCEARAKNSRDYTTRLLFSATEEATAIALDELTQAIRALLPSPGETAKGEERK